MILECLILRHLPLWLGFMIYILSPTSYRYIGIVARKVIDYLSEYRISVLLSVFGFPDNLSQIIQLRN